MEFQKALGVIGLTIGDLDQAISAIPEALPDCWEVRTQAYRRLVSEARKQALRRFHPDVCKDADALEHSQVINRVADALLEQGIVPARPPRPVRHVFYGSILWPGVTVRTRSTTSTNGTAYVSITWES